MLKELKARTCVLLVGALLGCCALCACGNADASSSSSAAGSASSSQAASESSSAAEASSSSTASESSKAAADADAGEFVGTWEMYSADDGNEEILVENAPAEAVATLDVSIDINEDGTASYHVYGGELPGTWELKDATTLRVEFDNVGEFETVPLYDMKLEDGMLVVEDGDITVKLKRV